MEAAHISIDGDDYEVPAHSTVLEAVQQAGVWLPALCWDPRLGPSGVCRTCLVEIEHAGMEAEGRSPPVSSASYTQACLARVEDGMRVRTSTPPLEAVRTEIVSMMARGYPARAVERFPSRPFHEAIRKLKLSGSPDLLDDAKPLHSPGADFSHPYIVVDMSRCILCFKCVRICAEIEGRSVWSVKGRGKEVAIAYDRGSCFAESSCVACGACVDTCPTGALEDRLVLERGEPDGWVESACPYCGTGCEVAVGTRDGRLVTVRPVPDGDAARGHLCVKGRYAHRYVEAPDRLTRPLMRRPDGTLAEVGWQEALEAAAAGLGRILARSGPSAIGVLGSARATNEENYLTQKFARAVLGTNNVDCCARVCHAPTAAALGDMFGIGAATNSFSDIECAESFLVCGANPTENHPVVGARILRAVRSGRPLVVIDPRRTEMAEWATVHLAPIPGTNVALLNSMAWTIIEEHLLDEDFVSARVEGIEALQRHLRRYTPEEVAGICGVRAEAIREAARIYATYRPAMAFHGLGVTEHRQGTDGVRCLANLALLTGNLGKPGSGLNPLRGQNNVQGSAHMGCEPSRLTGYRPIEEVRATFEAAWGTELPTERGLDLLEMLDAAREGRLECLWIVGYDILQSTADAAWVADALSRLELVVVQDPFPTETAKRHAHIVLPAALSFEKDGTFMTSERRIQRVRKALEPPEAVPTDAEILARMARLLRKGDLLPHSGPREVWEEIRRLWPQGAGITYERLESGGLQWPCTSVDAPPTRVLHVDRFARGPKASPAIVEYEPSGEQTSGEYPFILTTGRTLYQFNVATMTSRTADSEFYDDDWLSVSPADAYELGIRDGQEVAVVSRHGRVKLRARITDEVCRGLLFTTFHFGHRQVNRLTGRGRDTTTHTPEYKVTAVRVEVPEE